VAAPTGRPETQTAAEEERGEHDDPCAEDHTGFGRYDTKQPVVVTALVVQREEPGVGSVEPER
jgi:hypothetical protein